jgi:hypothetical protein
VALMVAFVLTFFPWVGCYPNGTAVYTQYAWKAARGTFNPASPVGEEVMKREAELNAHRSWSLLLVLYLLLLVVAVVIAVADRVVPRMTTAVPDLFQAVWPHRPMVLAGLSAALLLLLGLALIAGFGLESAAAAAVEDALPKADDAPSAQAKREMRRDVALAAYGLDHTTWLALAVVAHLVALFGAGLTLWLDRHPGRPDPRIECYC